MTTLNTPPVSTLLVRLFAEVETIDATPDQSAAQLSPEERTKQMTNPTGYQALYSGLKDHYLAVSRETGNLLYMLVRATNARSIIEFGTSFGISTLHLAAGLKDNGGGRLIGSEFELSKVVRARENLTAAGLSDLVEIREGDALETLSHNLPEMIDFVLLDGAKALYPRILSLLETRLRPGAIVIADNADYSPEYLARVRSSADRYLSVPFAGDVEVSMILNTSEAPK